jgi:hypothetical protein
MMGMAWDTVAGTCALLAVDWLDTVFEVTNSLLKYHVNPRRDSATLWASWPVFKNVFQMSVDPIIGLAAARLSGLGVNMGQLLLQSLPILSL